MGNHEWTIKKIVTLGTQDIKQTSKPQKQNTKNKKITNTVPTKN
jgi:hypothetical protein